MSVVSFRHLVTLGFRSSRVLLRKVSKRICNASGITTTSELPTNAGARRGLWFLVIRGTGFFTEEPRSPATVSLGTIWRLNILQIKRLLLINSLLARHTLSLHITGPDVRSRLIPTVAGIGGAVARSLLGSTDVIEGGLSSSEKL